MSETWKIKIEKIIRQGIKDSLSEDEILSKLGSKNFEMGSKQFSFYYNKIKKELRKDVSRKKKRNSPAQGKPLPSSKNAEQKNSGLGTEEEIGYHS